MIMIGTKELAIKLRQKNPCMTLQAIGDKCGVSRERVRQLLISEGIETKHIDTRTKYYCSRCGDRIFDPYTRNKGTKIPKKLCHSCSYEWHHVKVVCSVCKKIFIIKTSDLIARTAKAKSERITCSVACRNIAKTKYDHLFKHIARDVSKGMSIRHSCIKYHIPLGYQGIISKRMIKLGYKLRRPID